MPIAASFAELIDQGTAELLARRPDLAVNDGDVTEADLHAGAAMADACIRFSAQALKETFFDGAKGAALDLLVLDRLSLPREPATAAQVTLSFTRTSGGAGGTIPAGTTVATLYDPSGKQVRFTTDGAIVVPGADNGPFTIVATATTTGRDSNAAAGTIEQIVDALFDSTFTVTNAATAGGGNEAESDEDFRRRAKAFYSTLRRGTVAALEQGALGVATVRVATVSEDFDSGITTIIVGDEDGNSTAQMIEDVEFELENWRAASAVVNVTGAHRQEVEITLQLANVRAGFNVAASADTVEEVVIARGNKVRGGETLFLEMIRAAAVSAFPDDIFNVVVTALVVDGVSVAVADIEAAAGEVSRITSIAVTS